tara:strand:+ start:226 stop:420 length:195 start_codon:yes stop_codon:yes gene_type:complete
MGASWRPTMLMSERAAKAMVVLCLPWSNKPSRVNCSEITTTVEQKQGGKQRDWLLVGGTTREQE